MKKLIKEMMDAKIPILMKIADNDSVMNKKMNGVLVKAFGADADNEMVINKDGIIEKIGCKVYQDADQTPIKVIRSRSGGHFSFMKHSEAVNQAFTAHLERVLLRDASAKELIRDLASDNESTDANLTASDSDSEDWASVRKVAKSARYNFAQ